MSVTTEKTKAERGGVGETVKVVIQALALAFFIRTFLFQPFNIPTGSMQNTLLIGDYLFVSKYAYGYSRYSFPFGLPPFAGRVWGAEPKRGDIVVFKLPSDPSVDYVKRLIGLPGDTVQVRGGALFLNGVEVKREKLPDTTTDSQFGGSTKVGRWKETLPNGVSYETLDMGNFGADDTPVFEVPAGHYFMMGDNRDNSSDSRFPSVPGQPGVGFVPFENIEGRAEIIFFSVKDGAPAWMFWQWPWTVRWNRLFSLL
ncbi:MAG: signal peptidase I [Bauldia sp.]